MPIMSSCLETIVCKVSMIMEADDVPFPVHIMPTIRTFYHRFLDFVYEKAENLPAEDRLS